MSRVPIAAIALIAASTLPLAAQQPRVLSLDDAVRLAEARSEGIRVARAGATRAEGQYLQARSQRFPQLAAVAQYQRTLKSQFSALAGAGDGSDTTGGGFGGIDFSRVGFGARNQWVLGLQFSQALFTGGRIAGATGAALAGRRAADIEVAAQRAQVVLDVAQAYYDAALAERLVAIADSTVEQTRDVLRQTQLARQVGNAAEFDLLRAQVAYDNTIPVAIQARGGREVAMLRLKQLLEIPLDEPLQLATSIDSDPATPALPAGLGGATLADAATPDTSVGSRSVVRQAEENLRAQEALLRVARAERAPAFALTSNYQRLFFPSSTFPTLSQFTENWTVGIAAQVNLLSGGRTRGATLVARANVDEARARLAQVRELAALDVRVVANQLAQAEAAWRASQGTAEQATRAYRIDQVRYREGIATQTDLAQTRILLQQANANRATAARDLAVARIRLALIRDLPLQLAGASGGFDPGARGAGQGGAAPPPASQPPQQQQRSQQGGPVGAAGAFGGTP